MANNITKKMEEQRNKYEKLVEKIPGYKGYMDRERRRDADKLLRETLVKKLEEQKSKLKDIIFSLSEEKKLKQAGYTDKLLNKLEKVIDRIRFANYGYSGFFDQIKIDSKKLDKIYSFDLDLFTICDKLSNLISESKNIDEKFLTSVDSVIKDIDTALNKKNEVIL